MKNNKRSETSLPASFFVCLLKKNIFHTLKSTNCPNFIVWLPLLREILENICMIIVSYPGCDVINFEINFIFLIKPFFSTWPKSQDKNLNILKRKELLRWNKKHFSSIFKGLSLKQIKTFFGRWEFVYNN